ncbi:MAG TPA: hypothetical protein VIL88_06290 [Devosia sp.]|uniref:hypothetical protein n=1 Tax=Devosia sp. TaxID=1871048 RepID=UPI002F947AF4
MIGAIGKRLKRLVTGETSAFAEPYGAQEKLVLALLLAVALAIRVAAAVWYPSVHHPDETFQYWEQGHRFAFGQGMVPWEYRTGIRSYFIPGVLAGIMKAVAALGGGVGAWTVTIQVLLSALSLSIVATAFAWGRRAGGTSVGLLAGLVAAVWFETVYFAGKPLTESIAASLLFPAAYLLCLPHRARLFPVWGGVLLGLAFVVRFQLAPAVLVVALATIVVQGWRRSLPAALATLAVIVAGGVLDWVTLGSPFQSVWLNFVVNAVQDKASSYGVEPAHWFVSHFSAVWAGFAAVMVLLVIVGVRRAPLLLIIPLVIVLAHSAVGHKEYRFVIPAVHFVLTLAAIGAARLHDAAARAYFPRRQALGLVLLAGCFTLTSVNLANQPVYRGNWTRTANGIAAFEIAAGVGDMCGMALAGWNWVDTPGYRALGRDVPIYPLTSEAQAGELGPAFNVVVQRGGGWESLKQDYEEVGCSGNICVMKRAGSCTPMPDETVNPFLVRKGE